MKPEFTNQATFEAIEKNASAFTALANALETYGINAQHCETIRSIFTAIKKEEPQYEAYVAKKDALLKLHGGKKASELSQWEQALLNWNIGDPLPEKQ